MKKLAIVTTHPIQYNAPWFRLLAERGIVEPRVFYTWGQLEKEQKFDPGFGKQVNWDIPLLDGYQYSFVENTAINPGSHHRKGIVNPSLNQEIEQWQPDAILVFGWNFVSHLNCIRYFHNKIPVLFRGDSTLLRKQSFLKSLIRTIYLKWVYRLIDYALYVGTENKKYFLHCGLTKNQLLFAPHAIDNDRFADKEILYQQQADEWKNKLGIPEKSISILFAGKLEPIKNVDLILNFAERFVGKPVHFIIAGNGQLEDELKLMACENSQVKFIDFQNQQLMPVVYRLADFFILSSVSETWGLGVNEAMACGRAVLVRDTCGCAADLVKPGKNGFVFNESEMNELYGQVIKLVTNKVALKNMGIESQKMIASFSFKHIVSSIENYFKTNTAQTLNG